MANPTLNTKGHNIETHASLYHAFLDIYRPSTAAVYARSLRAFMAYLDRLGLDLLTEGNDRTVIEGFILSRPIDSSTTKYRHRVTIKNFYRFVDSIE